MKVPRIGIWVAAVFVAVLTRGASGQDAGVAAGGAAESKGSGAAELRDETYSIPVTDARRHVVTVKARICRYVSDTPARVVIINHGAPPNPFDRVHMKLGSCEQEAARWFLTRGYVVVQFLRRGYGESGGDYAEQTGSCGRPDFVRSGVETARDIDAVTSYAENLPFVSHDGAVVVGQSAGGWGTIGYDGLPHPAVVAFVVMAGGRGGHHGNVANSNCRPDLLAKAAGMFGKSATTPMLWIYTANDSFFAPPIARAMWREFTSAGGKGEFEQLGPFGEDGHHLFFGPGGSAIWGPFVERYLAEQHALAR
jgi:dienelactone hydrolase